MQQLPRGNFNSICIPRKVYVSRSQLGLKMGEISPHLSQDLLHSFAKETSLLINLNKQRSFSGCGVWPALADRYINKLHFS